jgi:mono/diheme cytochrome c family protein
MSTRSATRSLLGLVLFCTGAPLAAQDTASVPFGVDSASIAAGRALYKGRGGCVPCHGEAAEGTPDGPSLVTGRWILGDGGLPWLLHIARHAGWGTRSREGDPRPMRGPTVLDSTEVRQVAAYVFSVSRRKQPPRAFKRGE